MLLQAILTGFGLSFILVKYIQYRIYEQERKELDLERISRKYLGARYIKQW